MPIGFGDRDLLHKLSGECGYLHLYKIPVKRSEGRGNSGRTLQKTECNN
ncbi:hypothetical protein CSC02_2757 [Enterobacter hormaechei subsp. hoffmannii]|nr:hypothetical protein CSC02_2757 [Enterobacter hormaechei subsp. hoffmannii]